MPTRTAKRIIRDATLPLWKRDQLEMRAVDKVLAALGPKPRRRRRPATSRERAKQTFAMIGKTRWAGFRSILCPVDFSEPSRWALRYAAALAVRSNATLGVLYVNDPLLVASASAALHDRQVVERSEGELNAFIDTTVPSRARRRVTSRASTGRVPEAILNEASRRKSELIVMGTHGLSGVDRLLIGSTVLSVLLRTKVPVLAVPSPPQHRPLRRHR